MPAGEEPQNDVLACVRGCAVHALSDHASQAEGEILLTPSHRFTVNSEVYEKDGYTMLDMIEHRGEFKS